jgi:hypothetical protein
MACSLVIDVSESVASRRGSAFPMAISGFSCFGICLGSAANRNEQTPFLIAGLAEREKSAMRAAMMNSAP